MREKFAHKFMHMIHNKELLPENVIWTDECMLSVGPHINRQNDGRWLRRGEQFERSYSSNKTKIRRSSLFRRSAFKDWCGRILLLRQIFNRSKEIA